MTFADATTWERVGADERGRVCFRGAMGPEWTQGRGLFGGVAVGGVVRALGLTVDTAQRPLRSLLVSFVGPVLPEPFECRIETIRTGGSFSHLEARVVQGGEVRLVVSGGYGAGREGGVRLPARPRPEFEGPDVAPEMPYAKGLTPEFVRHYRYRLAKDSIPFCGSRLGRMRSWLRLRDPAANYDVPALVGLLDAPPPPIWPMLSRPARGASVTWHATLLDLPAKPTLADDEWFCFESQINAASHGYVEMSSTLWGPSGKTLMVGHQVFADFSDEGITVG